MRFFFLFFFFLFGKYPLLYNTNFCRNRISLAGSTHIISGPSILFRSLCVIFFTDGKSHDLCFGAVRGRLSQLIPRVSIFC